MGRRTLSEVSLVSDEMISLGKAFKVKFPNSLGLVQPFLGSEFGVGYSQSFTIICDHNPLSVYETL